LKLFYFLISNQTSRLQFTHKKEDKTHTHTHRERERERTTKQMIKTHRVLPVLYTEPIRVY